MPWIPLHQMWHIYPHQLSIDALNTATPNLADLLADVPPSIKHRCLEYCYTTLVRYTGRSTPSQSIIDALHTVTPNLADLPQRTSTYERPFTHEDNYLVKS